MNLRGASWLCCCLGSCEEFPHKTLLSQLRLPGKAATFSKRGNSHLQAVLLPFIPRPGAGNVPALPCPQCGPAEPRAGGSLSQAMVTVTALGDRESWCSNKTRQGWKWGWKCPSQPGPKPHRDTPQGGPGTLQQQPWPSVTRFPWQGRRPVWNPEITAGPGQQLPENLGCRWTMSELKGASCEG